MMDRPTLLAAAWTALAALPVYVGVSWLAARLPPEPGGGVRETAPAAVAAGGEIERKTERKVPLPEPLTPVAPVVGTLRTPDGTPVPDEIVELESLALDARYAATSDARGRFAIPDVGLGPGYEVRVLSEGRYRSHVQQGLAVGAPGLALELVLEPLARARLGGRMVDAHGVPIPGRGLVLHASHEPGSPLHVTGDERGHFRVDDAPTGRLTFSTRSVPHLKVRGPLLTPGSDVELTLVLDEGAYELGGRIVGDRDVPVAGAQLKLSWSHKQGGSLSSSARTAVTDAEGGFRFQQLGPGPHRLAVRADGYEESLETYAVVWNSDDVELRLRPLLR